MKNIRFFLSEKFPFLVVNCSIYLNRRVFVMLSTADYQLSPIHQSVYQLLFKIEEFFKADSFVPISGI